MSPRPHRAPASRSAWIVVLPGPPLLSINAYALFDEVAVGRRRALRIPPSSPACRRRRRQRAARRGVDAMIVFRLRNDSRVIAAASRSCYADLLAAGVGVFELEDGPLYARTIVRDGQMTLLGSAHMDRRGFDLDDEKSILARDPPSLTRAVPARQDQRVAASRAVTAAEVAGWPPSRRPVNNAAAMLGPLL